MSERDAEERPRRWQRREARRKAERERMRKHNAAVRHLYPAAVRRRAARVRRKAE